VFDMTAKNGTSVIVLDDVTNGGELIIADKRPVVYKVGIVGTADILFHAWNVEAIAEKAAAAKGSRAKKEDDVESFLYRTEDGFLGIPGVHLTASMREAGRYMQDPRSPRKSAMDMVKSGVVPLDTVAPIFQDGKPLTEPDYLHRARVVVQRNGVTRTRPGVRKGYTCEFRIMITIPEYLSLPIITSLLSDAGRLSGLADFRPTYGRFAVTRLEQEIDPVIM
jgi:hypothetical protein